MLETLRADLPWPLLLLAPLGLAALAALLWWRTQRRQTVRLASSADAVDTLLGWAPQATRVLTTPELRAHATLVQALPQHIVLAQVSLARFIRVPTRNSYAEWLRRVGHLSADLVICDAQSQVVAVVEVRSLRERGGERVGRRQERFAQVLKAVGIPLYVWVDSAMPSVDEVRRAIVPRSAAAAPASAAPAGAAKAVPPVVTEPPEPGFEPTQHPPADEVIEMREPPSSTWFDDYDSSAVPLDPSKPQR